MGVGNYDYTSKMGASKMGDGEMKGKMGGGKMGNYTMGKGYSKGASKSSKGSKKEY